MKVTMSTVTSGHYIPRLDVTLDTNGTNLECADLVFLSPVLGGEDRVRGKLDPRIPETSAMDI